jgi:hypothetical protein
LITDRLEAETAHNGHTGRRGESTTHRDRCQPDRAPSIPDAGLAGSHLHVPVTASPVQTHGDPTYLNTAEAVIRAKRGVA